MKHQSRRTFLKGVGLLSLGALLTSCAPAKTAPKIKGLPSSIVWSTYNAGIGSYNDVAAIANTLTTVGGVQVRLMGSDTSIGRIAPLVKGIAQYARAAEETFYAFEGNDEYASEQWGPQSIRQLWTPPGFYGIVTLKRAGIRTPADLKGKKIPRIIASVPNNRTIEAVLNFAGISKEEVQFVDVSYSEQADALKAGNIDAMYQNVISSSLQEVATREELHWLDIGGGTPEQYETWPELVPVSLPGETSEGAGMKEGDSAHVFKRSIPLSTMADRPTEEVYNVLRVMVDHFTSYENSTADTPKFAVDKIQLTPLMIPFHDGAVQILKEEGRWNDSLQARNNALVMREKLMQDAWPEFWEEHKTEDDTSAKWIEWKKRNLPALPEANVEAE